MYIYIYKVRKSYHPIQRHFLSKLVLSYSVTQYNQDSIMDMCMKEYEKIRLFCTSETVIIINNHNNKYIQTFSFEYTR